MFNNTAISMKSWTNDLIKMRFSRVTQLLLKKQIVMNCQRDTIKYFLQKDVVNIFFILTCLPDSTKTFYRNQVIKSKHNRQLGQSLHYVLEQRNYL